jgi:hypothetical protein
MEPREPTASSPTEGFELHFDSSRKLVRTVLEEREPHGAVRRKVAADSAAPGEPGFRWSRGMKVLALALVTLRLRHLAPPEERIRPLLEGGKESAANAFCRTVFKTGKLAWIDHVFQITAGYPARLRLDAWFTRRNPECHDPTQPVRVYAGREARALRPGQLTVWVEGQLAGEAELRALADTLAAEWAPARAAVEVFGSLPPTGAELFGRRAELAGIDAALHAPDCRLLQVVAPGGLGKTALVNHWLRTAREGGELPFARVVLWSFYRQGYEPGSLPLLWPFCEALARAGGVVLPRAASPREIVELLSTGLAARPTLLVLDGIETLLHAPGPHAGQFREDLLPALLARAAAGEGARFTLLTTRLAVGDAAAFPPAVMRTLPLQPLTADEGRRFLRHLGVEGTPRELDEASAFAAGQPLILRLLASLAVGSAPEAGRTLGAVLAELRQRPSRLTPWRRAAPPLARVLHSYAAWLAGTPELALLRLSSLFDRHPEESAVEDLLAQRAALPGLLDAWPELPRTRWQEAAARLRQLQLAAEGEGLALELHPLVQNFFAEELCARHPATWRAGHLALYEFFRRVPDREQPETLEEMEPLLRACVHGCLAGVHQRAFDEVAYPRVSRALEIYPLNQLGAVGETLAFLSCFAGAEWKYPATIRLSPYAKGCILGAASQALRVQERYAEGRRLAARSCAFFHTAQSPVAYGGTMVNLIRLHHCQGQLRRGLLACARLQMAMKKWAPLIAATPQSALELELAEFVGGHLGMFLLAVGRKEDAAAIFADLLPRAQQRRPGVLLLPGVPAINHGLFLLETGDTTTVLRAIDLGHAEAHERTYELNNGTWLLKGRAWTQHALDLKAARGSAEVARAGRALDAAVQLARNFGRWVLVADALLARARWQSHFGTPEDFQRDVQEARETCRRLDLRLVEADLALLCCRHALAAGRLASARESHREASRLVRQCHYRWRVPEVAALAARLAP